MCGIIGYSGHRVAVPLIMEGLRRLEYRGYDSAGVAYIMDDRLHVVRAPGKLIELDTKLASMNVGGAVSGIGHTRWATHGLPNEKNAHPHRDAAGHLALAHNGIVENFQTLRCMLQGEGASFVSDTDTESLAHLLAKGLQEHAGDMLKALAWTLNQVDGSFALAIVRLEEPGVIYGARRHSPLVLGVGEGENFIASDIPAFLPYTRNVVFLDSDEIVRIDANSWGVWEAATLAPVHKTPQRISWDVQAAQKGGYKHFMLKEIFEQPRVVADCLAGRLDATHQRVCLEELAGMPVPKRLHVLACGTSYHAGLWGMHLFEDWARIPVSVEIASEFRYRNVLLDEDDAVLIISQSGETADSLACLQLVKSMGVPVIGLCNVVGSSIARESDRVVYTQAGPEISVASTKAMCSQLTLLTLMALHWGQEKGTLREADRIACIEALRQLPALLDDHLPAMREKARELSRLYADARSFLFLGRGHCCPLALEGALKLKEISYIHAEGYAAGEMKHGPIALIDPHFPTFALALDDALFPKVKSNLQEVQARNGEIIALTNEGMDLQVEHPWIIPRVWGPLGAFMALPALQLFAYETADYLGKDVDQPRNLAKSVTVE
ncbi:glutamine--fructose-6-phosphate transaminase (isomerizing) [Megalodesulfovibrio gigas]|uniref:Glutamine--fructose-6-phosphate aminotransferase [isomerizing] n=1 Tax=Megalodesulfovibrio gigas (strain ATCC 19364 / DSM 1382 / NCIMB 9332 / VKM B-1759) TaxID=1121448 RepID=T2G8Y9_MEGG1|nr:glutamine--fructose-6-phosphate transaminase (isomerizing) [Megalodesulfovibrio gigas]AGW12576.1 putative glucosamine/fructose-6-phosphate aminotransferase [Megalodesulfovibrio gigas DSM 1382 = ATCC 19364]